MKSQQENETDLHKVQRLWTERRDDFMFILKSSGFERTQLNEEWSWNNVANGRLDPDGKTVSMIRALCRKARLRSTYTQRQALRRAVMLYCSRTLYNQMIEPMGSEDMTCDVVSLFQNKAKEEAEADSALAVSLQAPNPQNDERAAREVEEAALATARVAESLRARAARAFNEVVRWS